MTLVVSDPINDLAPAVDDDVKPIDHPVVAGDFDADQTGVVEIADADHGHTSPDHTSHDDTSHEYDDLDDDYTDRDDPDEEDESLVRAFTLTGGRTQNTEVAVAIQSVVCQSQASLAAPPMLAPVESAIWLAAGDRLSSAEISYRLELPLGVVRVLVGDLVTAGLVTVGRTTATGNAQLVRRLIDGVRSL